MRKQIAFLLSVGMAALMLASCTGGDAETSSTKGVSSAARAPGPSSVAGPAQTSSAAGTASASTPAQEDQTLIASGAEWHYQVFSCPYIIEQPEYPEETDEMLAYQKENPEWYQDYETMEKWPTAKTPLGDRIDAAAAEAIGWTGDNHGLIVYHAFQVEDLEALKTAKDITLRWFYDNTVYFYLNGKLCFVNDGKLTENDWVDDYVALANSDFTVDGQATDIRDLLVEGENTVVISLKDGHGGRELDLSLTAIW